MRKLLNILFVTSQGAYLNKEGETVVVSVERVTKLQVPIHTLQGIVCFGNVAMSPFLMGHCAEQQVSVSFLTEYGKFLASVHGKVSGNVLLRRAQYRMADDSACSAKVASNILKGKIANARSVLQRAGRDHGDKLDAQKVTNVVARLQQSLQKLDVMTDLDSLRGVEGDSAADYFDVFDELIVAQKNAFVFDGRNRRPPQDNVNCLLSFVYTLLMHDVRSALEVVGLDPCVGFLHRDRPGRAGLALDLMEEFRAVIADRLVLSLINRLQVNAKDFEQSATGAVLMKNAARKELLTAYQKRKQEEVVHPFINETVPVGMLFYVQAMLLARFIRGDIDGYPPYIWK